eukprot:CAMPEP_0172647012 /NCGR_PEP_ID=MMETSP1068-20121228/240535_1 /TAXON_ID=35684 /ORGANISM="Pseudopedinella elastica, Strain CCMP716" /LENGTH=596 /DNA_ID=CAMNT_0013461285 /DNA_START=16 /DNA_END=1808 /DNA_ORIENTATION=-
MAVASSCLVKLRPGLRQAGPFHRSAECSIRASNALILQAASRHLASYEVPPLPGSSHGLWIGGEEQPASGGDKFTVSNPANLEPLCEVAEGRAADVDKAVATARTAFEDGSWSKMPPRKRAEVLSRAADLLARNLPALAEIESLSTGRCLREYKAQLAREEGGAQSFAQKKVPDWRNLPALAEIESLSTGRCLREYKAQLARVPDWLVYHGQLASTFEGRAPPFSDEDHACVVTRVPLGVCALVTPWNHPLLIAVKKAAPALASGNTVVVKPPELAPVAVLELGKILQAAGLPPGVFNVVPGLGGVAGAALCAHPQVAKVDFTGGTETGRAIGAVVGLKVAPFCAELGGNCAVLVFNDVDDLSEAVDGVAFGAFVASGQTCVSAKRVLVEASLYGAFVERLARKARGLALGCPMDGATQMGPLVSARQLQTVEKQVEQAVREGARVVTGGRRAPLERCRQLPGHFYEPTVLTDVSRTNHVFQEEVFGPVVSVTPFATEAEGLELANDSKYGLGAVIWTSNVKVAHRMARDIQAGVVWVNAHHRNDPSAPWGGFKESGIGRENGLDSFLEYTQSKSVVFRLAASKEDWFGDTTARYS